MTGHMGCCSRKPAESRPAKEGYRALKLAANHTTTPKGWLPREARSFSAPMFGARRRSDGRRMAAVVPMLVLALLPASPLGDDPAVPAAGVVVEDVEAGWAAERARIQPGDLILSWSWDAGPSGDPPAAGGAIESPFDLGTVEMREVPRGQVKFEGRRGAADISWVLAAPSGLTVRPQLPEPLLARHREAMEFVRAKEANAAAARCGSL